MRAARLGFWLLAALCGCTGQVDGKDPQAWTLSEKTLALSQRDWNPNHAELTSVAAVAEDGDAVIIWSASGAAVMAGGALTATDASVNDWRLSARIPAADGSGFWPVGVDTQGQVYRLRALTKLEAVSDRYGLLDAKVQALAPLGGNVVAFGLGKELALADGKQVTRYPVPATRALAGTGAELAAIDAAGEVRTFDVMTHDVASLALRDARSALYKEGRLLLATASAVYSADAGRMVELYRAKADVHGLVLAGARVWLAEGTRLCALDGAALACSAEKSIAGDAQLTGSESGDVWVIAAGALERYGSALEGDEAQWQANVFSVYARVCSACHAPGGSAGVDLSSYAAWRDRRAKVYDQVIVKKAMPPDRVLADADRAAIEQWAMP